MIKIIISTFKWFIKNIFNKLTGSIFYIVLFDKATNNLVGRRIRGTAFTPDKIFY